MAIRRHGRALLAWGCLVGSPLLLTAAASTTPAAALSCAEPAQVTQEQEHLFVGHVLSVEGDRYLFAPTQQRPGAPVPPRVVIDIDLTEWESWGQIDDTDAWLASEYRDVRFLVSTDDAWRANVCTVWPLEPDLNGWAEWLEVPLGQVTQAVQTPTPSSDAPALQERLPDAPASTAVLASAAICGVALGSLTLGVFSRLRHRRAARA